MSEQGTARQEWPRLWPHQAAFIEQFFADPSKRGYLLQSDVGLGASSMATHLIQHATETIPNARILMLVSPKIFQVQMQHMLASLGVVADIVDRFRYRELQDAAPGQGTVWRGGTVSILSVAFAKQKDITCSLSAVSWTLLVVLEAHVLLGLQEQVVRQIVASSPNLRMVLITTTDVDGMPTFGMEPFTMTRWRRSQVVDHAGQRVFIQPLTDVEVIEFHEEAGERRVREAVEEFAPLAGATDDATSLLRTLLLRSLASSPVALEERLRRFRNQLAHGTSSFVSAPGEEDDAIETMPRPSDGTENREKMLVAIDRCLAELESLSVDSKLNSFVNTLIAMRTNHNASGALCIVTAYRATLFYLQTQLEDMELTPYILHGAMSFDGRAHTIHEFEQRGGILLATTAMLTEGIALPHVTALIFYDLPPSALMLQQVYGRFHRFGRTVSLTVHVLCDPNSISSEFSFIHNKLKALVTDNC